MDNNFNNYNQNGFNQASQNDGAMGWDDTITAEAKEYTLLPVGTYQFIIKDNLLDLKHQVMENSLCVIRQTSH